MNTCLAYPRRDGEAELTWVAGKLHGAYPDGLVVTRPCTKPVHVDQTQHMLTNRPRHHRFYM